MRQLHGPLRLRADRRGSDVHLALEGDQVALRGPRTEGPMAPEISLEHQRPAQYIFSDQVQRSLTEIRAAEAQEKTRKTAAKAESASTAA